MKDLMKQLHRHILALLPGPFLGWLSLLMFLLLMQFLIKYLPDLVGKGLPRVVVAELIMYNLAYMLVLAVPMAILVATFTAFGKLSESNAYLAIKSAGISLPQLIWPAALAGILTGAGMLYFNNEVLPEANFRAKNLWQDIRQKKPGFALQPGVFYDGLSGYSILAGRILEEGDLLHDVLVLDYSSGTRTQTSVKAQQGRIKTVGDGSSVDLILRDGEMHRRLIGAGSDGAERYERVAFDMLRLRLDLTDLLFERRDPRDGYRSDRTMRTSAMRLFVDSLEQAVAQERLSIVDDVVTLVRTENPEERSDDMPEPDPAADVPPSLVDSVRTDRAYASALQAARARRARIEDTRRNIAWEEETIAQYRVELHKKTSIAVACLIFVLLGIPLGLSVHRHGFGRGGGLAVGIFLFYWVTLVEGEKLADRGMLPPWFGMWFANGVMLFVALWMLIYVTEDLGATLRLRQRWRRHATPVAS